MSPATQVRRVASQGGSRSPLPVRFVGGGQLVEKGAVHLHQRLQHVVHQRHDGPSTQQQKVWLQQSSVSTIKAPHGFAFIS